MIAAISLMKRRPDLTMAQFRKHWLDPHGVMTAELPGVRFYVQHHFIEHRATNALARSLDVHGIPELWFDDYEGRRLAYTSPRIAECNIDSEQFVGAVTRLVTEPLDVISPPVTAGIAKALILAVGAPDPDWADAAEVRLTRLSGIVGYKRHRIIEQAAAPNSRIPELKLQIAGLADVTFKDIAALEAAADRLAGSGKDAERTAVYVVEDVRLV